MKIATFRKFAPLTAVRRAIYDLFYFTLRLVMSTFAELFAGSFVERSETNVPFGDTRLERQKGSKKRDSD